MPQGGDLSGGALERNNRNLFLATHVSAACGCSVFFVMKDMRSLCSYFIRVFPINLIVALKVLRYGGSWGISTGRRGSHDILGLWDNSQCLISDQHAAAKCADTSRPLHVSRMQGLGSLLSSIFNGIEQVSRSAKHVTSGA